MNQWFRPAGSGNAEYDVVVTPGDPGWVSTGLRVATLAAGESRAVETGGYEWIVLPLSGSFVVEVEGARHDLAGRPDVFSGPTDLVYVGRDSSFTVTSVSGGRVALPFAVARSRFPVRYVDSASVPVELRGAGSCSRQVQNFGTPAALEADSIIACEVITPGGNWSSYPPHKHDEDREGVETALEEIYYFQMRVEPGAGPAPSSAQPAGPAFGYQRVYGTAERPIDVLEEVRTDDVVLVPHGWHGPAMAPAGYDMYYLNVMAGPGQTRAWLICDDPAHAWVRGTWAGQPVDPRLPYGSRP
ncbi:MAG: 5-deoxy-glucuronate isomerase [Dermatophilaceae bacterium]